MLAAVARLPISEWTYEDDGVIRHLGPMAEDLYAAFSLGRDETTAYPADGRGRGPAFRMTTWEAEDLF